MAVGGRSRYALATQGGERVVVAVAGQTVPKEVDELAAALTRARRQENAAKERQAVQVAQMRTQGASWGAVGACLGVTREAAFKRYSKASAPDARAASPQALDEVAAALTKARRQEHAAVERQALIVQKMRTQGASWAVIGSCLGVTREAAFKRYSKDQLL